MEITDEMNIVAIGGGEMGEAETLPIDKFIVELTGKSAPKALYIPTAGGDRPESCARFDSIYQNKLGCRTDHLRLFGKHSDRERMEEKILSADLIYVGGGNTLRMMKLWRKLGTDQVLAQAGKQGTILSGISAGAICWHAYGHSDSQAFSADSKEWAYIRVQGMGLLPGTFCPHLDKENRHEPFVSMIRKKGGLGIACDNNAAVWYRKGALPQVKCASSGATVKLYRRVRGEVEIRSFHCDEEVEESESIDH